MTPLERQLRRQLTGLRISFRHSMRAVYDGRNRQKVKFHRTKADRLRKEMKLLEKQIEVLALAPVAETVIQPGRYRHYKGKDYEVVGIARHSETLEELIVYRALYGEHGLWIRPKAMFAESVEIDGRRMPRFEFVGAA